MKLTPQELMDLPNYGDAERALRKQGDWESAEVEYLEDRVEALEDVADDLSNAESRLNEINVMSMGY